MLLLMTPTTSVERAASTVAALTALAVAAPVISIIVLAATPVADLWPHLIAYVLPRAIADTALLLGGVGLVALLVGGGTAWLVSMHDFPGRRVAVWLLPLPLAIPTYLAAYVYVDLFEPLGLVNAALALWLPQPDAMALLPRMRSLPGAIGIIAIVLYPYVYLSARAMFQLQSAEFVEAARMLGAGRWTTFRLISLPMARPALAVGTALVALETLNDIGASDYLGVRTLTVSVFTTWLNRGSLPGAAQMSVLLLALVALLVMVERHGRREGAVELSADSPRLAARTRLRGWRGALATLACATPAALGFVADLTAMQEHFLASEWADRVPVEVELSLEIVLGGHAVRGRVDAVFADDDGGVTVVDWKTGRPPRGGEGAVRAVQLSAYRIAYARWRGIDPQRVRGAFFHAATGETIRPRLLDEHELVTLLGEVVA